MCPGIEVMAPGNEYVGFVGTRGEGSHEIFSFDVDPSSGTLTRKSVTDVGPNPSYLAVHPTLDVLYAVNQVPNGTITAMGIDRSSGELSGLNRVETEDRRPCYVSVEATGRFAFVAHHTGGSVSILPLEDDGRLRPVNENVVREGSGPNSDRQSMSRPHAVLPGPGNRFVYVPDLGADRVWIYEFDPATGDLLPCETLDVALRPGSGPRHLVFHPNERFAYLINELNATITAFRWNPKDGSLVEVASVPTLPSSFTDHNQTADIHVHPSGRWLYGSNRGHDSIAIFELEPDTGRPNPMGHTSTRGEWPRNFAIGPTGLHLYAENQRTNEIVVFAIDTETGELTSVGDPVDVPRPVCMKILAVE